MELKCRIHTGPFLKNWVVVHHGVGVGTILVPQLFHEMDILSSVKTIMSTV